MGRNGRSEFREQALVAAELPEFPLAMKINSPDITHKSDVPGVRLDI